MRPIMGSQTKQKGPVKRGEKEALSLRRRRIIKTAVNIASVTMICTMVIVSIYLWRSGSIASWINTSETKIEQTLVNAGLIVENITIIGEEFVAEDEIRVASGIQYGDALLSLDINSTINRIEQLEWVKNASVRRDFSGDVIINVKEHRPAAIWQVNNKLWIVSDEGIQISDKKLEYFADLPMISGLGAQYQLEELIGAVSQNKTLFDLVETATWVGGRRWDLILKNGIKIMMPETDLAQAWEKLSEFEQGEQLLARNIMAVDFRIKDKTIVRLTPEEAERRRLLAKTSGKGEEI